MWAMPEGLGTKGEIRSVVFGVTSCIQACQCRSHRPWPAMQSYVASDALHRSHMCSAFCQRTLSTGSCQFFDLG